MWFALVLCGAPPPPAVHRYIVCLALIWNFDFADWCVIHGRTCTCIVDIRSLI